MNRLRIYYNLLRTKFYINKIKKIKFSENVSLISQNCVGGIIYHDANQRFLSPTVNLYILPKDFIKFVNNLDYYLSLTPKVKMGKAYPIGTLGDIKINFMHYFSPEEAVEKFYLQQLMMMLFQIRNDYVQSKESKETYDILFKIAKKSLNKYGYLCDKDEKRKFFEYLHPFLSKVFMRK